VDCRNHTEVCWHHGVLAGLPSACLQRRSHHHHHHHVVTIQAIASGHSATGPTRAEGGGSRDCSRSSVRRLLTNARCDPWTHFRHMACVCALFGGVALLIQCHSTFLQGCYQPCVAIFFCSLRLFRRAVLGVTHKVCRWIPTLHRIRVLLHGPLLCVRTRDTRCCDGRAFERLVVLLAKHWLHVPVQRRIYSGWRQQLAVGCRCVPSLACRGRLTLLACLALQAWHARCACCMLLYMRVSVFSLSLRCSLSPLVDTRIQCRQYCLFLLGRLLQGVDFSLKSGQAVQCHQQV
jgi:hypothetical protein